jgi:uroporphyrinogen-III decarboxylase
MNGRQRLLAALRRQPVDRVPWAPLFDEYFTSSLPGDRPIGVVDALRSVGADVLERHVPAMRTHLRHVRTRRRRKGNEILTEIETPAGTLTERRLVTPVTTFIAEPKIKGLADFRPYRYCVEHTEYEPDYAAFLAEDAYIGDDGLATVSGPQSPVQFLIGEDMGVERFVYTLYDHPDELGELVEVMHENRKEAYRILARSPALVVIGYEDVSTSTASPEIYRRFTMRYLDDYAGIVHAEGKLYLTHMCGLLKGVSHLIALGRMDGVDSVTPPTTGDLPIEEARAAWPGKVIVGGLEPKSLAMLPVDEVRSYARDVLRRAAPGDGFILSTGDATAYGTPVENLRAVTEVVQASGRYPLGAALP